MITLSRVRLVRWHYFEDSILELGESCLLAGDNGSGKSTIVDAIQYTLAADLRKARFNSAAGDRKGGRDLAGYVRCKLGSETTEFLRGDTVSHVMLEFSDNGPGFILGACVEGFNDGRVNEHFWIGEGLRAEKIAVSDEMDIPLSFRLFKDGSPGEIRYFDSKKQYLRESTAKLGVWRRMAEYNPYLEAFTRSVSFTPLVSVDKFVCDYILEDRPVDISTMKANLESYKEAEREANAAIRRIEALNDLCAKASEWRTLQKLLIQQEYLKLVVERELAVEGLSNLNVREGELRRKREHLERTLREGEKNRYELDLARQETETALARNDAHLLYQRTEERIGRLSVEIEGESKKADRFKLIKGQCEVLLNRKLAENLEKETVSLEEAESAAREQKDQARRLAEELEEELRDVMSELADLERGIPRYPEAPTRLQEALEGEGLTAHFLADLAEVNEPAWVNAVEGWLNTLRFAVLVAPDRFQEALEIYDGLPKSVGGAFLPNLAKMRGSQVLSGSLAELVETESPYARIYLDFVLGDVMTADIASLKNYSKAITQECMSYANHTASRVREEVYRQLYLGREAKRKRKEFLVTEADRLRRARDEQEDTRKGAAEREELFRGVYKSVLELQHLYPALETLERLTSERAKAQDELAAIDTQGFKELQDKRDELRKRLRDLDRRIGDLNRNLGETLHALEDLGAAMVEGRSLVQEREAALKGFSDTHLEVLQDCEAYAKERLKNAVLRDLAANYEAASKGIQTRSDRSLREYHQLVQGYNRDFNALLSVEPAESREAEHLLERLERSELPEYREKIERARRDAEREFKDHFISRLNEFIEEARESFREINEVLRSLAFGRDQYRFTLEERSDRRGQIEIVRKAAEISAFEDSLFAQLSDPKDREAAERLFDRILKSDLDSPELRSICDYRTYFNYDIKTKDTESIDQGTGKAVELSLSRVLREKSGGEVQTPYYVAIAASFYRFFKNRPEDTIRFVMFDEAFNRMDDERIGKILEFYRELGLQIMTAVPTEKIEAIAPYMDRVNLVIRHGYSAFIRDFHRKEAAE